MARSACCEERLEPSRDHARLKVSRSARARTWHLVLAAITCAASRSGARHEQGVGQAVEADARRDAELHAHANGLGAEPHVDGLVALHAHADGLVALHAHADGLEPTHGQM